MPPCVSSISSIPRQTIAYDEIGELAAQICQCPVAYISFMDDDRLWLKAKYGLPPDLNQCPREIAFCATTICGAVMGASEISQLHQPHLGRMALPNG